MMNNLDPIIQQALDYPKQELLDEINNVNNNANDKTNTNVLLIHNTINTNMIDEKKMEALKAFNQTWSVKDNKYMENLLRLLTNNDNLSIKLGFFFHNPHYELDFIEALIMCRNSNPLLPIIKSLNGLSNMLNLKELDISYHEIEKIQSLNNLKRLRLLNLSHNRIIKIENLSSLKNLEILNLSHNLIQEIPAIISKNHNLIELSISYNGITRKDTLLNLKTLIKLKNLDIEGNPVTNYSDCRQYVINNLKQLTAIDKKPIYIISKKSLLCVSIPPNVNNLNENNNKISTTTTGMTINAIPIEPSLQFTSPQHNNNNLNHNLQLSENPSMQKPLLRSNDPNYFDEFKEFNSTIHGNNNSNQENSKQVQNFTLHGDSIYVLSEGNTDPTPLVKNLITNTWQNNQKIEGENKAQKNIFIHIENIKSLIEQIYQHQNQLNDIGILDNHDSQCDDLDGNGGVVVNEGDNNNNMDENERSHSVPITYRNTDALPYRNTDTSLNIIKRDHSMLSFRNNPEIIDQLQLQQQNKVQQLTKREESLVNSQSNNILIHQLSNERAKAKAKLNDIITSFNKIKMKIDNDINIFHEIADKANTLMYTALESWQKASISLAEIEANQKAMANKECNNARNYINDGSNKLIPEKRELLDKMSDYLQIILDETDLQLNYLTKLVGLAITNNNKDRSTNDNDIEVFLKECDNKHNKCDVISLQIINIETDIKTKSIEMKSQNMNNLINNSNIKRCYKDNLCTYDDLKLNYKNVKNIFHKLELYITNKSTIFYEIVNLIKQLLKYHLLKYQCIQNDMKLMQNIRTLQQKFNKIKKSKRKGDLHAKAHDLDLHILKSATTTTILSSNNTNHQFTITSDISAKSICDPIHFYDIKKSKTVSSLLNMNSQDKLKHIIQKSCEYATPTSQRKQLNKVKNNNQVICLSNMIPPCKQGINKFPINKNEYSISKNIIKNEKYYYDEILQEEIKKKNQLKKANKSMEENHDKSINSNKVAHLASKEFEEILNGDGGFENIDGNRERCQGCEIKIKIIEKLEEELQNTKSKYNVQAQEITLLKEEIENMTKTNEKEMKRIIDDCKMQMEAIRDEKDDHAYISECLDHFNNNITKCLKASISNINSAINMIYTNIKNPKPLTTETNTTATNPIATNNPFKWIIDAQASTIEYLISERKFAEELLMSELLEVKDIMRKKYERYFTLHPDQVNELLLADEITNHNNVHGCSVVTNNNHNNNCNGNQDLRCNKHHQTNAIFTIDNANANNNDVAITPHLSLQQSEATSIYDISIHSSGNTNKSYNKLYNIEAKQNQFLMIPDSQILSTNTEFDKGHLNKNNSNLFEGNKSFTTNKESKKMDMMSNGLESSDKSSISANSFIQDDNMKSDHFMSDMQNIMSDEKIKSELHNRTLHQQPEQLENFGQNHSPEQQKLDNHHYNHNLGQNTLGLVSSKLPLGKENIHNNASNNKSCRMELNMDYLIGVNNAHSSSNNVDQFIRSNHPKIVINSPPNNYKQGFSSNIINSAANNFNVNENKSNQRNSETMPKSHIDVPGRNTAAATITNTSERNNKRQVYIQSNHHNKLDNQKQSRAQFDLRLHTTQFSNLGENIAQQILSKSKNRPDIILSKLHHNVMNYKKTDNSFLEKNKTNSYSSDNPYYTTKLQITSPKLHVYTPLSSARTTVNNGLSKNMSQRSILSPGDTNEKSDVSKDLNCQSDSRKTLNRELGLNFQLYLEEKRNLVKSPSLAKYNDKFDLNSPYHPMYQYSAVNDSSYNHGSQSARGVHRGQNDCSSFTSVTNSISKNHSQTKKA